MFWGSQWSADPAKAAPALQNFFKGLFGSTDPWATVLDQYCQGLTLNTVNCSGLTAAWIGTTSTAIFYASTANPYSN